jgi:hypothetical protein
VKSPCKVKPDPNDPTWTYPYATRARIESLAKYMSEFGKRSTNWHMQGKRKESTRVLPNKRKNKIPFESVPPHLRFRAEQWFNRKVAEEQTKGILGWPSPGKIRSLRMNACNAGRHMWNGEYYTRYRHYLKKKKAWLMYLEWKAKQERQDFSQPMPHKVLECA